MFWVILIIVVVGVFYYSFKHDDYHDISKDHNRDNSDSDEDSYTYFDDISAFRHKERNDIIETNNNKHN